MVGAGPWWLNRKKPVIAINQAALLMSFGGHGIADRVMSRSTLISVVGLLDRVDASYRNHSDT